MTYYHVTYNGWGSLYSYDVVVPHNFGCTHNELPIEIARTLSIQPIQITNITPYYDKRQAIASMVDRRITIRNQRNQIAKRKAALK